MAKTSPNSLPRLLDGRELLSAKQWRSLLAEHDVAVGERVRETLKRRSRSIAHPVYDFLFTYYSARPSHLLRWSPGLHRAVELAEDLPEHFLRPPYRAEDGWIALDREQLSPHVLRQAVWIEELCRQVATRPAVVNCYGLHEWAMVYALAEGEQRHENFPLRLSSEDLKSFLDGQSLCCTHYDAFRFFTPAAAPHNRTAPTYEERLSNEQPGCVHTNMDLYKWCYKLGAWCPGELLAECFLFASRTRELDMRASPYDLADLGFLPIQIETAEGRREYARQQAALAQQAEPLRQRLSAVCAQIRIFRK